MDAVYNSYNANATSKINIAEYFARYRELIGSMSIDLKGKLGKEEFENVSQNCSINKLITEEYLLPPMIRSAQQKTTPRIPSNVNLQTLSCLKEKYSNDPKVYRPALKYQNETTVNYSQPIETDPKIIPGEDILVYIRIYHPFRSQNHEIPKRRMSVVLNHVIVMLGHQTLAELRDKIDCVSDLSCTIESSENPTEFLDTNNRDTYKSSFFYIENTFYNDTRHEESKNNSEPIINWAKTRKLGPFHTEKMEDVRVDSLTVRFGYPWVFQHQGNCEHLITFSDARLVNCNDHSAVANYPRIFRARPVKNAYCLMCIERPIHWIVIGNDRLPHDPCHFCHQCFIRYNYIDGKKIGTFKAYRYPRDTEILKFVTMKKKT
ncbi:hypothetical protein PV328_003069 [Microctonus aethiopoides]|uniref:snRNA-activating protein complex subunit 3 n=1 Tax=Microctonus aethiopoides TaxID=144406 RepID=A0AA39KK37_9HYME|nr:hypothetical protein PV328_003069 [Microctonus aethiopoides]